MADPDAAPPEVVAPEEHQAAADSAAAAAQDEALAGEVDHKRKLEEVGADVETNGDGEDAKRPRVDSETDASAGTEQQNDGSSVNVEEPAAAEDGNVAPTEGVADGDNGTVAASEVLPLEPTPEAAAGARQQEGDAATASPETSRKIEVPNSKVGVLIGGALHRRPGVVKNEQGSSHLTRCVRRARKLVDPIRIRIGSWNVGLLTGRLIELVDTAIRRHVNILCVQETKWKGQKAKEVDNTGFKLWYTGTTANRNGVGVLIDKSLKNDVVDVRRQGDRIILVKLIVGDLVLNVITACAPQVGHDESAKRQFWEDLDDMVRAVPIREKLFIGGDLNGQVGTANIGFEAVHGGFGFGSRNQEGEEVLNFALAFDLLIANTFFRKRESHLVTFNSGQHTSQIDFILTRRKDKRTCLDCKVLPGECVVSQHKLVVADFRFQVHAHRDKQAKFARTKWWKLKGKMSALTPSVELVGTLASVDKAEQLIKSVIAEAEAGGSSALIARGFGSGQSGSEQFEMTVPDNKVGLIIGKGGETIKGLQTRSGARIQLIPQHPPEGVTLTERTVRVTGNKKQIEVAKDLIKQAMNQNFSKHANQSGGYGPQGYRPQGHGEALQWGPRSQSQPGYGYPPRGMPPPQNYNPAYGGYPQQGPPRGGMGWDQRQSPPPHPSYQGGGSDYYKQGSQPYDSQPPSYPPGPGNYNSYGQSQAPGYGQPPYPQHAPQQNYGHGYGDPRYNAPPPNQYYGQPPMGPQQGYPQQADPYARPSYSGLGQWAPRGAPAADGSYQPPPASDGPPSQQPPAYGQTYGAATAPDGYAQQGYPQQSGQAPAPYSQNAPAAPGYPQQGTQQGGYAQYPQTQPAYGDQAAQANANYGYQGAQADPNYGSAYPQAGYGPPAPAAGPAGYASAPAVGQAGCACAPAAGQPAAYVQAGYT